MKANTRLVRRVVAVFLTLVTLDGIIWAVACDRIERGLAAADLAGWQVSAGRSTWTGWPSSAIVELRPVTATAGPDAFPPGLVWTAGALRIGLSWLHPRTLEVEAIGEQSLAVPGLPPVVAVGRRLALRADLAGAAPPAATADDLSLSLPDRTVTASRLRIRFEGGRTALALDGIGGLGPDIEHLGGTITVSPPFSPAPTAAQSARRWRDAGGRLSLDDAAISWAGLAATAHAAGGLDDTLQPYGEAEIAASGLPNLIDGLVAAGQLAPGPATAAKAILMLRATPASGGPTPIPLRLAHGILSAAGVPVLRLPPLAW